MSSARCLLVLLVVGCSSPTPGTTRDADSPEDAPIDMMAPHDTMPIPELTIALGPRIQPFEPWDNAQRVIIVTGPQGAFHTEHAGEVHNASVNELHLAIIWAEVWRDDLVMARSGWEFWQDQWKPAGEGFGVELPPLIFDEKPPQPGQAELRGSLELVDGREATFAVAIELVNAP